ncbi:MAG: efflux RND transporter permease subunit [Rhodocyclaceae bacterium]|nr:efflux RND transporter permease subunit [Rhodocyclaceae bacterium]
MSRFNLSDWGLRHQRLVLYLMVVLTAIGMSSYGKLGQSEDPPFTFKVMVVRAEWPGASAREVELQVTDKIERKLQEVAQTDVIRSYSRPGEAMVFFAVKDATAPSEIPGIWYQVRKKIGDIRRTLPQGVVGPSFNDEFGDTFGNIFALLGEGLDYAELKRFAEAIRNELLRVPDVAKVEFFGEQPQRVFIELSAARLATLGIRAVDIIAAINEQNAKAGAGFFETTSERIFLRPDGEYHSLDAIRGTVLRVAERSLRLGDIAEVSRGFADPPRDSLRFEGRQALGIGVSMRDGGDIISLGRHLDEATARIQQQLPAGIELARVADQPRAVQRSINEFVRALTEAVVIVLAVSLLSLGLRTGIVVAISIPVVLAVTFLFMHLFGIGLHKISLGALILALGLLVDDAIIAVEMMATKMEQGLERAKAAGFAYTSTAMPMLSGTLVTAAGFLPIATAASSTGEYTRSLFQVTVIALLVSWVAAVLFVPYLGFHLLPDFAARKAGNGWRARLLGRFGGSGDAAAGPPAHGAGQYDSRFYRAFRAVVNGCVRFRWVVILATVLVFVGAIYAFRFVPQQFFPDSTRPELLVDLRLAEGASRRATLAAVEELEAVLAEAPGIENFVAYVASGSPRFYLPLDQQLPQTSFAQFVILAEGPEQREALRSRLIDRYARHPGGVTAAINRLENGPPVGFPVQYRVSGADFDTLREVAGRIAEVMRGNAELSNVQTDWATPSKILRIRIDQDRARLVGLSSEDIARILDAALDGVTVTQFREGTETIDVVLRGSAFERGRPSNLADLSIPGPNGRIVPLAQVASVEPGFEEGVIWRRNRIPTVTVRANLYGGVQPAVVVAQLAPQIDEIRAGLPLGYRVETGGAVEESAKGGGSVAAGVPLLLIVVLTVLMLQLQNFSLVAMVLLTAPLGLIGITAALLLFGKPFGFVAMIGSIALSGMIMRNSVILVDQIQQDLEAGLSRWDAIVEATVRRFRPIMLTAAAAILAMIPLTRSAFFGPMAVAIMGGLAIATVLTLIFLPSLYAAWYRVRRPSGQRTTA